MAVEATVVEQVEVPAVETETEKKAVAAVKSSFTKEQNDFMAAQIDAVVDRTILKERSKAEKALAELQTKHVSELTKAQQAAEANAAKIKQEFDKYKADIELRDIRAVKTTTLKSQLESSKANPELIPLVMKEFVIDELEVEEGKIKGWDEKEKGLREKYASLFGEIKVQGAPPVKTTTHTIGTTGTTALDEWKKQRGLK